MANTFSKIASVSVGLLGASTVDFTSIPQTYTDLVLKFSNRASGASAGTGFLLTFNGSSSNYSRRIIFGEAGLTGSNTASDASVGVLNGSPETSNSFASAEIYIPNYTGSSLKSRASESVMAGNVSGGIYLIFYGSLWADTSAITSMTLTPNAGSWVQYTTATLYGIKKN